MLTEQQLRDKGFFPDGKGGFVKRNPATGERCATFRQPDAKDKFARECELHEAILRECKQRGWIPFHGSMAHKTFRTPGEPDFIVMRNDGQWLAIEAKTESGKLSPDQQAIAAWAETLGHKIHVVRSIEDFFKLI